MNFEIFNFARLCSLERFLCCMELEKGAVALGWWDLQFTNNFIQILLSFYTFFKQNFLKFLFF